jgi:hypothetical protein
MIRLTMLLLLAALAAIPIARAQALYAGPLWTRTYGTEGIAQAYSVCRTSDGGFAATGRFRENPRADWDVYLVRTDSAGDTVWTRTFGGHADEVARSVVETADGGFVIAGRTESPGDRDWNIYLLKTGPGGEKAWVRTYGGTDKDFAMGVIETTDGGLVLVGGTMGPDGETYDIYMLKTDGDGNEIWEKTYGGDAGDFATSVAQTADGGFIIGACTESFGEGSLDVYLIRTDTRGQVLWARTYGGEEWDMPWDVHQTADGGYIAAGETGSFAESGLDVYLVRTDADGEPLWTSNYGGEGRQTAQAVWQTEEGDFIVGGYTYAYQEWGEDIYIGRVDAGGRVAWVKTFGGPGTDIAYSILQALDGACVVAGQTSLQGQASSGACIMKIAE